MKVAIRFVVDFNLQHFLLRAPMKKIHIKIEELYVCVVDWRIRPISGNHGMRQKCTPFQVPSCREHTPLGEGHSVPHPAMLEVQLQCAFWLLRNRFLECLPLDLLLQLAYKCVWSFLHAEDTFGYCRMDEEIAAPFQTLAVKMELCALSVLVKLLGAALKLYSHCTALAL